MRSDREFGYLLLYERPNQIVGEIYVKKNRNITRKSYNFYSSYITIRTIYFSGGIR